MAIMFTIDQAASRVYAHAGFSASVYGTLALTPGLGDGTFGIAVSGSTLIHCDDTNTYKHAAGWTATIASSFANAWPLQRDIYWDGTNLQAGAINDGITGKCIKYSGITATVLAMFDDEHPKSANQIAGAGNTQLSTGNALQQFRLYSGFTGTLLSTFNVGGVLACDGSETDGTNFLVTIISSVDVDIYTLKLAGFTATILDFFASPTDTSRGIAWSASSFDSTFKSGTASAGAYIWGASWVEVPTIVWSALTSGITCVVTIPSADSSITFSVTAPTVECVVNILYAVATLGGCVWFEAAAGEWFNASTGEWFNASTGGWFDPRECP